MDQPHTNRAAKERDIFLEALDQTTPEARAAYLDVACRQDAALRRKVEAMLADHFSGDSFMARPAAEEASTGCIEGPGVEFQGAVIGRYKLLEKIGEGGCGVVYMAEQEEPVRRRVALKVIKLGMDTRSVIARFEAERQALAMMDHPNIAKIYDAGATGQRSEVRDQQSEVGALGLTSDSCLLTSGSGRPYFVMELVRGVRITDYCDQNNLPTGERLALFTQVCHAIQHAHQKGIIHRDIKPSNILVTLHDGVPVPKVIDFGIAKATTDQRLTDKTLFTALEQFIGTPAYMSPEQAEFSGLDIDTRSDIYSLGVLLYELLTGRTPFDSKELLASGLDEMRRTIREKEPERPSTRLTMELTRAGARHGVPALAGSASALSESPEGSSASPAKAGTPNRQSAPHDRPLSAHRMVQLKELIDILRGDLDWIVMKCLEKDRTRRYETANGLTKDIERHLGNEPITARPPSHLYRFQKMVRRNKLAFAAVTAVVLALIGGLGLATLGWRQARVERDKALTAAAGEEKQRIKVTRNLYFAEMNLGGQAAADPGGLSRIPELTSKWLPKRGEPDQRGWEWYYLRSLLHHDLFTLSGHTNAVQSVAWSPDGKRLASASLDNTVKLWDAASMQVIHTLRGHTNGVRSVSWSPDGKRLASCSLDKTVKVWDADSGQNTRTMQDTNGVRSVAWSPDGKRLASGSWDSTIKVWNADSGHETQTLRGHTKFVLSVAWSPDGKRLASGSGDDTVKVWDVESGTNIHTLLGHSFLVESVSWSPDGKRLASGSWDDTVKVWDAHSGTNIHTLRGHIGVVPVVSWSPDGNRLASGSYDNTVKLWDANSGQLIHTLRGHTFWVNSVSWSPDGKRLASASGDNAVKIWDADSEEILTLRGHTNHVLSVAWSPDGNRLASASFDSTVKVCDAAGGLESMTLPGHIGRVYAVAWSPDGKRLASGSGDRTVKVWNANSGTNIHTLRGHNAGIYSVAWSPDGKRLASGSASEENAIKVWDASSGQAIMTLPGHKGGVGAVSWSLDGQRLVSGSQDHTVKIWDAASGKVIHTLAAHTGWVLAVAWSPDEKFLASASDDNTVKVWDAASGRLVKNLTGHTGGLGSVSWSPDGQRLASGGSDTTVKIWEAASGLEILTLRGHTASAQSVAWNPDGKRLASGSFDNTVKIWDARKGYAAERE